MKTHQVLIVDDDEFERKVFNRTLGYLNIKCEIHDAWDVASTLQVLAQKDIDCVFLDYNLGSITAFDIIEQIKAADIQVNIAIITALKDQNIAVNLLKAGAIDYINKADLNPDKIEQIISAAATIKTYSKQKNDAEIALKNQLAKIEAILESTQSAIFAVDKNYLITGFNSAFSKLYQKYFATNTEPQKGINIQTVFSDRLAKPNNSITRALSGENFTEEQEIVFHNFDKHYFEMSYNPIKNEHSEIIGVAVFAQDITDKKRNEEALLKAKNEALQAAQAKSDFLSNMSHEIRTPMNAIIGITDLLLDKLAIPENREYLQSIKYSADNLLHIINDILDLSKIEAGKVELEEEPFNLEQKINELKRTFQPKANEKKIELITMITKDVPAYVKGDQFRLNQILLNLISNAIKFTSKGSITVRVELKKGSTENCTLLFSVTDSGIGIAEDKLNSIFDTFTQAYTDTTRKFGGTGLGLAISKNLVQLQQGYMGVHSKLGAGSTFYFEIPYKTVSPQEIKNIVPQQNQMIEDALKKNNASLLSGARILLVEDNSLNQFVAKQLLKKWESEVAVAETGVEALHMLAETEFDIVLMDLQMPEMNGFEATAQIRSGATKVLNPKIPIIALTADAFEETRKRVIEAGMNDFITKPFKQDDLYGKISRHINR
jgi:PAS domain S-box-containing protein